MKVAVLADIHGNLPALERVLGEIEGMPKFCCGDLVGYNPFPNEVIELVKKENIVSILGNHDYAVLTGDTSWFNPVAARAIEWTIRELTGENLDFLKTMAQTHDSEFYMIHGSPKNPLDEYIYPEASDYVFKDFFNYTENDVIALGHTHSPFVKRLDEKLIFNPGSVGQPRDSDNRASYAIMDLKTKEVEIKRVDYDIGRTAETIIKKGLPERLASRLFSGI
jgi:putative phosphoesterase